MWQKAYFQIIHLLYPHVPFFLIRWNLSNIMQN